MIIGTRGWAARAGTTEGQKRSGVPKPGNEGVWPGLAGQRRRIRPRGGDRRLSWRLTHAVREESANPDGLVARIAARQHGVVTTAQLKASGIGWEAARRRVMAGRLHRLHRGFYAVGHAAIGFEGRCLAAVLALGAGAVLSHRSAAELWGIVPHATGLIHVTVPTDAGRRKRKGLLVHRSRTLGPDSTAFHAGVLVTTPARTLADLRRGFSKDLHQRATRRALDLRLISPDDLGPDPDLTRSELERAFLSVCRRYRLPQPEVNSRVGPYEVDFLWPAQRVIVETDGFAYHRTRAAFERDRARDAYLQARGYTVLRVTHRQLRDSRQALVGSLRRLLERR